MEISLENLYVDIGLLCMTETSHPGYTSKNVMTHQSAINSFNNQIKIQDPKDLDRFILTSARRT